MITSLAENLTTGSIVSFQLAPEGKIRIGYITRIDKVSGDPIARVCTKPGQYFEVDLIDADGALSICDCGRIACTHDH